MTAAKRVEQLARWHELARLIIGRAPRDAERVELLEQELLVALDEATREHEAEAKLLTTLDALIEEQDGRGPELPPHDGDDPGQGRGAVGKGKTAHELREEAEAEAARLRGALTTAEAHIRAITVLARDGSEVHGVAVSARENITAALAASNPEAP